MKLRGLMSQQRLTVKALAQLSGISPRVIEAYTSGRRNLCNAQLNIGRSLAKALGVHAEDLLDEPSGGGFSLHKNRPRISPRSIVQYFSLSNSPCYIKPHNRASSQQNFFFSRPNRFCPTHSP